MGRRQWLDILNDYDLILYHLDKVNVVADVLSCKKQDASVHVTCLRMMLGASLFDMIRQAHREALAMENSVREKIRGQIQSLVQDSRGLLTCYVRI